MMTIGKKIVIKWSSKTVRTILFWKEFFPQKVSIDTFMLLFLELLSFVEKCFCVDSVVCIVFLLFYVWAINAFTDLEPWFCRFICYRKAHGISNIIIEKWKTIFFMMHNLIASIYSLPYNKILLESFWDCKNLYIHS